MTSRQRRWKTYFLLEWQGWYAVLLGFIGIILLIVVESKSRKRQQKEEQITIAKALYFELYNRLARCALDATTWTARKKTSNLDKFRPTDPHVYNQLGRDIGMLPDEVLADLVMFYFRLDAVRIAVENEKTEQIPRRLCHTLKPGQKALASLEMFLEDEEQDVENMRNNLFLANSALFENAEGNIETDSIIKLVGWAINNCRSATHIR